MNSIAQDNNGLYPVANLDPVKYQGKWYEIASIPASFQKDCFSNTRAQYTYNEKNETIKVINSCDKENGKTKVANGVARVNPKYEHSSQLQVTFVKFLGLPIWAFGGDYWVLYLDEDYQVSLVGEPSRKYAWILSREKRLEKRILENLREVLVENGYNPCTLLLSRNDEQAIPGDRPTLCEHLND